MNLRGHAATIVIAAVTAAVVGGGAAVAGRLVNADRLQGYAANQLIRAAGVHKGPTVEGDGTLATVSITAPRNGYLLIVASTYAFRANAEPTPGVGACELKLDGVLLADSYRAVHLEGNGTAGNANEIPCATNIMWPVASGQHSVRFVSRQSDATQTFFADNDLDVVFVPFNGIGKVPAPAPPA
jgi:hypothetical protein